MIHIQETNSMRRVLGSLATFATWAIVTLSAATAHADLVYSFNNYPDVQFFPGEPHVGTLSGTITVTDTAPDDGILGFAEVLAWNWTATNGPRLAAANSTEENSGISVSGADVLITETDIMLPQGHMIIGVENATRTAILSYNRASLDYSAFAVEDFIDITAWSTEPAPDALGGDPWVIATIVPEPATVTLLISALLAIGVILACRRLSAAR